MPLLSFRAHGIPKGQPRPRAFAFNGKARMYDPGTAEGWKSCVAAAVKEQDWNNTIPDPVRLSVVFLFPRPGRLNKKSSPAERIPHVSKPDADNCLKSVMDCMTQLGMWIDDAQVCGVEVEKWYVSRDEKPGAEIRIDVLSEAA